MVPASRPFFGLHYSTRMTGTPSTALWICPWASPNKWVSIEKQAHAMVKTKDLYPTYCPTRGCTHHPVFP